MGEGEVVAVEDVVRGANCTNLIPHLVRGEVKFGEITEGVEGGEKGSYVTMDRGTCLGDVEFNCSGEGGDKRRGRCHNF